MMMGLKLRQGNLSQVFRLFKSHPRLCNQALRSQHHGLRILQQELLQPFFFVLEVDMVVQQLDRGSSLGEAHVLLVVEDRGQSGCIHVQRSQTCI